VWNDIHRYPDLPMGNSNVDRERRNRQNEFQISHVCGPFQRSIVLHLWALVFEKGTDAETLRVIANRILNPNKFTLSEDIRKALRDTQDFFSSQKVDELFQNNRKSFIAHVLSVDHSAENFVEDELLYRLIPKAIYLMELLHFQLLGFECDFDTHFKTLSKNVAPFFHHTGSDEYLDRLFSKRTLPTTDYKQAAEEFFFAVRERERFMRRC
jgi:hypothetical protein